MSEVTRSERDLARRSAGDNNGRATRSSPEREGHNWTGGLGPHTTTLLLEEDPDLGDNLSPEDRQAAEGLLRAKVITITSPRWEPPHLHPTASLGFLVLDGLLGRRLRLGKAISTELLGTGDILRPDTPTLSSFIPPEVSWRVFRRARLAVLDERITKIIGLRPQLIVNFSGRLLRRARHGSYLAAISHLTRVEDRVLLTLWHLASNWGRVTPQGFCIPFHLTHEVLGEIIGARRPSVTLAIADLQHRGDVTRRSDGFYVLREDVETLLTKLALPGSAS